MLIDCAVCVTLAVLLSINSQEPYEVAVTRFIADTAAKYHVPTQPLKNACLFLNSYTCYNCSYQSLFCFLTGLVNGTLEVNPKKEVPTPICI